jgi:hypothetical protein
VTADPIEPALHRLEAERLRPTRDETPADPWMALIHLLANPGPPDRRPAVLPPGLPDPTKIAPEVKETPNA